MKTETYRIKPKQSVRLNDLPTRDDGGFEKKKAEAHFEDLLQRLSDLQEMLHAEAKRSVLVVLQAMDAAGKDSTIRHVFGPLNPQGCKVHSFKAPTDVERRHDYLWRIHQRLPERGQITVFNRSHYEDVLIARVKELVDKSVWKNRFDHINDFERMITDEGVTVVKFYLHISKDYQKERLQRRLDLPDKRWKFNPADLLEREHWDDYRGAFEDVFEKCSTEQAPWYIIPAERRWYRNLLVATVMVETLERLKMSFPPVTFEPWKIEIP